MIGSALQNLACGIWWNYLQTLQKEAEKMAEQEESAEFDMKDMPKELVAEYSKVVPLFKKAIKSYESKLFC